MGKSAGLDGATSEMFFHSLSFIPLILSDSLTVYSKSRISQSLAGRSIIVPLHKKGTLDSSDNHRGIVLRRVFCLLNTSMLTRSIYCTNLPQKFNKTNFVSYKHMVI